MKNKFQKKEEICLKTSFWFKLILFILMILSVLFLCLPKETYYMNGERINKQRYESCFEKEAKKATIFSESIDTSILTNTTIYHFDTGD